MDLCIVVVFYVPRVFQFADEVDKVYLNSDQLWRRDDQYDTIARQAFENLLYVSVLFSL